MNRLLAYPAAAAAVLFLALYASIAQSTDRRAADPRANPSQPAEAAPLELLAAAGEDGQASPGNTGEYRPARPRLDRPAAEQMLKDELLTPWSLYTLPRHRLFSRAAPRRPMLDSKWKLSPLQPQESCFLAVASLANGASEQQLPVVVDRHSKAMFVFAEGGWQPHQKWLDALLAKAKDR